jgi:hypothetical protein
MALRVDAGWGFHSLRAETCVAGVDRGLTLMFVVSLRLSSSDDAARALSE